MTNALELQRELTGETREVPETLLETYPQLSAAASSAAPDQRRLF